MDREKIALRLAGLIAEGEGVCATRKHHTPVPGVVSIVPDAVDSKRFKEWSMSALATLRIAFGEQSDHYQHAKAASETAWRASDADDLLSILKSAASTFRDALVAPVGEAPGIEMVALIADRFHDAARQLRRRHDDRPTLDVADEYDVQDLLHVLLRLHFADIREEESTPSVAGAATRMDFLLKSQRIVIEAKMTRKGLGAKELGEELLIDIAKYRSHPDCETLVCFVYDPDGRIKNPAGVERDLETSAESPRVRVFIRPR